MSDAVPTAADWAADPAAAAAADAAIAQATAADRAAASAIVSGIAGSFLTAIAPAGGAIAASIVAGGGGGLASPVVGALVSQGLANLGKSLTPASSTLSATQTAVISGAGAALAAILTPTKPPPAAS